MATAQVTIHPQPYRPLGTYAMASKKITPLLRFLRALTSEQREAFAQACGTTVGYLYQIAAQPEPNPRLRLALALCAESRRLHRRIHADSLTLDDLLIGPDPHASGMKTDDVDTTETKTIHDCNGKVSTVTTDTTTTSVTEETKPKKHD